MSAVSMEDFSGLAEPETAMADIRQRLAALESRVSRSPDSNRLSLVVFSGQRDRLLAALTMAVGAAACGMKVNLFFTFWATAGLKRGRQQSPGKRWIERCFGWFLPGGFQRQPLSHLDFWGFGRWLLTREMHRKGIADVPELLGILADFQVPLYICEMSMSLMGISHHELIEYPRLETCGVAVFLDNASHSATTLFI